MEEFTQEMDFDLDALELPPDSADLGVISISIKEPHISFNGKDFVKFISLVKNFSWNSGRDLVSKSVCIKVDKGKLLCKATDQESYLEYKIDLINVENVISRELVLSTDVLLKLVKASQQTMTIKEEDGQLLFQIIGGWYPLEEIVLDPKVFTCTDESEVLGSIEETSLKDALTRLIPFVQSAVTPQDRCIRFTRSGAEASYMWSKALVKGSFVDTTLKFRESVFLKNLISGDGLVTISRTTSEVKRIVFQNEVYKYMNLEMDFTSEGIEEKDYEHGSVVDFNQLNKLITLSSEMPSSLGKVSFTSKDGIFLDVKNRIRSKSLVELPSKKEGEPSDYEDKVLQSRLLRVLFRVFGKTSYVKLSLVNDVMVFSNEHVYAECKVEE